MACTRRLLSLCDNPVQLGRDGWGGANARIYIPFHGFYYFSGAVPSFPNGQIPQNRARYIGGVTKPDTFQKYGGVCAGS